MQTILNNPLASSYTLGISTGAGWSAMERRLKFCVLPCWSRRLTCMLPSTWVLTGFPWLCRCELGAYEREIQVCESWNGTSLRQPIRLLHFAIFDGLLIFAREAHPIFHVVTDHPRSPAALAGSACVDAANCARRRYSL